MCWMGQTMRSAAGYRGHFLSSSGMQSQQTHYWIVKLRPWHHVEARPAIVTTAAVQDFRCNQESYVALVFG